VIKSTKVVVWVNEQREAQELAKMFQETKFEVLYCSGKNELDQLISENNQGIGLIILDAGFPAINILALSDEIKKNVFIDSYIMVIGDGTKITEIDALDHGADIFIYKPVRTSVLSKRVLTLLEKRLK
jgi:DNA-binding response OmpR family regulator